MMKIKKLAEKHWAEVAKIYQEGIDTKNATFRTEVPGWECWNTTHFLHSRFVVTANDIVLGWCAISPVSQRTA